MTDSTDNARVPERMAAYLAYINEVTPNGNNRITNAMLCAGNEKRQQDHIEAQMKLAFDAGWLARSALEPDPQDARVAALVEALQVYADGCDAAGTTSCGYEGNMCCMTARATLAAFDKGGKTDD